MSKRELTEGERKARRDKALKPLQRCLLWAEAERLRGEALHDLRIYQNSLGDAWGFIFTYARDPSRADDDALQARRIYFEHIEHRTRQVELEQRKVDHYTAETKRLRAQAWEQGR